MMTSSLQKLESQLKKRWAYPYQWHKIQNNNWDNLTRFIYDSADWDKQLITLNQILVKNDLYQVEIFNYAINRWYNYWSSVAIEEIFCSLSGVTPAENKKDKQVDFYIHKIPFDHKTSVFPKGFGRDFAYAKANKNQLIGWLYAQQSSQQRQHFANRLFVIVHKEDGNHWKLKAQISLLHHAISNYVVTFDQTQLVELNFSDKQKTLSDIIWVTQ